MVRKRKEVNPAAPDQSQPETPIGDKPWAEDRPEDTLTSLEAGRPEFAPESDDIHRSADYRTVPRPFSDEQQQTFLKQLYDLRRDHSHMQGELDYHKDLAKSAQKRIDSINDQMHGLLETLEAGNEDAEVLCEKVINYTTDLVTWFAEDTGELVFERALTKEERQRKIHFPEATEESQPTEAETAAGEKEGEADESESNDAA